MEKITGDENAYPLYGPDVTSNELGLTIRQHFAAMAMQGIASNQSMINTDNWEWLAKASVNAADALITALNAPPLNQE